MSASAPLPDGRSPAEVQQELSERARAWMPEWQFQEIAGDPGNALMMIAARMCGEVISRLARTPEKNQRGFIEWLGIQPLPPQAASMPLIFQLTPGATAVTAEAGTRVQASLAQPTSFETQTALTVVPGNIMALVGIDPAHDRYFLPSAGLLNVGVPSGAQSQWTTVAAANYPVSTLQLSSASGLAVGQILVIGGSQHRIIGLQSDLLTFAPSIPAPADGSASLAVGTPVQLLTQFAPFADGAISEQQHALFIGDPALMTLQGAAQIDIVPADPILSTVTWSYWGVKSPGTTVEWQTLDAPTTISDGITLVKPVGAASPLPIAGKSGPWLRALLPNASTAASNLAPMQLRVRSVASASAPPLTYTAVYNNTPLVTDTQYFPLGLQPRTFDCFYLACAEALGKVGAQVNLNFDAGTGATPEMAVWETGAMLFGVSEDRRLQRIQINAATASAKFLSATQPKQNDDSTATTPTTASPIFLTQVVHRPAVVSLGPTTAAVLVSAGQHIWVWHERANSAGFWSTLGDVGEAVQGLLALPGGDGTRVVALTGGRLRYLDARLDENAFPGGWRDLPLPVLQPNEHIQAIAAVRGAREPAEPNQEIIAVSDRGRLFHRRGARWSAINAFAERVDPAVQPLTMHLGEDTLYIVALKTKKKIAAWRSSSKKKVPVTIECSVLSGFDVALGHEDHSVTVLMLAEAASGEARICWWRPLRADMVDILFSSDPPSGPRGLAGGPSVIGALTVASGSAGNVFVSALDVAAQFTARIEDLVQAAVLDSNAENPTRSDRVIIHPGTTSREVLTVVSVRSSAGRDIVTFDLPIGQPDTVSGLSRVDTLEGPLQAKTTGARSIEFAPSHPVNVGDTLMLAPAPAAEADSQDVELYTVANVESVSAGITVSVDRDLHLGYPTKAFASIVKVGEVLAASVRPALSPATAAGLAAVKISVDGAVYAADATPNRQPLLLVADSPALLVLSANWQHPPGGEMVVDALLGTFSESSSPTSSSPDLQWEYWNDHAWWMLTLENDNTNELLETGTVTFYVPSDLNQVAVQGKKDLWIRARLISGDYGQPTVTVTTSGTAAAPVYTVNRDDSSVHPPTINSLNITYRLCNPASPAYVVTFDNGTYVDQSTANSAVSNTVVSAFVPLAQVLAPPGAVAPPLQPSLFVGFDRSIQGNAINLFWDVVDNDFSASMPLQVSSVGPSGQMTPLNVGDQTRALGESNLLTVNSPSPMTPVSLFGQSLYWLCLQPTSTAGWSPTIDAVYLNAVWSVAEETQTLEILGSSIGAPSATFSLLRPPVIANSLQLRVRESLSDAELTALRSVNSKKVITDQPGMPGNWVLWKQVADPSGWASSDRVYSLESDTGVVVFGDGVHGKVPPIGRDNVVAFEYKRGGGAAANAFAPWDALNLVTPVQGVSIVLGPQSAAGGADAEPPEQVINTAPSQIRQRDRAITPRDIEQLALQSSPDILQARSWQTTGAVRIVAVVAGSVAPSIAQSRALRSFLVARSTPALAALLQIVPPRLVSIGIGLSVAVSSFDLAAQLGEDINQRLTALFDPQTGGVDGAGWPLGRAVTQDDIAAALSNVQNLGEIQSVALTVTGATGQVSSAPPSFSADQYPVWLANGLRIRFQLAAP